MYRILSIDGGGLRGLIPAVALGRVNDSVPSFVDRADLIAGTSTGGIIALGIAFGMRPEELLYLYRDNAAEIFKSRGVWDSLTPDEIYRANYDNNGLRAVLQREFGNARLCDLKKKVIVATFDLNSTGASGSPSYYRPRFLHNFDRAGSDSDVSVVDAAMRTSAAPTYFPSYQGFIDGGIVANNPAMCALAAAIKDGVELSDVRVLSLGTGYTAQFVSVQAHGKDLDYGYAQWYSDLMPMLMDGQVGIPDYQARQFLGDRYFRLDPLLDEAIKLDDVSSVPKLVEFAYRLDLSELESWLRRRWMVTAAS